MHPRRIPIKRTTIIPTTHSKSITQIMAIKIPAKQDTFTISYQRQEAKKIIGMEYKLMEHFGFNRSQLHKNLVRDAYRKLSLL